MRGLSYEEALTLLASEERPKRSDSEGADSAKARQEYERLLRELERVKPGPDRRPQPNDDERQQQSAFQ